MKIALAYAALLGFFPFALYVFRSQPRAQAAAVVVISGSILLPENLAIDLPAVPPMDKEYVTYLSALLAAWFYRRASVLRARPGTSLELILVLLFFANVATAMKNSLPMMDEGKVEDGLGLYWVLAQTMDDVLTVGVPFFVGRALFTSLNDLYVFLRTLVVAATLYTGLISIEVLMSIPFKVWLLRDVIYGLPAQPAFRWGQVQPNVFMDNGLALASFMAGALIAAAALTRVGLPIPRVGKRLHIPALTVRFARNVIAVGMICSRNIAGIVYGLSFLLAHMFAPRRLVMMGAISLSTLACVYPSLRMADLFPYEAIVEFAREYDADRARSLEGRFFEEEHVLGQIGDRLWLGWGTYTRIPGAETFGTGEVGLDGWVTIRLGTSGVIGVALYVALLAIPVFRSPFRIERAGNVGGVLIAAMMCMVSIRMIDLIINGWWNCLPVFLAGVLMGVTSNVRHGDRVRRKPRSSKVRPPEPVFDSRPASIGSLAQSGDVDGQPRNRPRYPVD